VILESTVYPGVTETVLKQILEESGLICGADFKIAYSPERINPGDTAHVLENTTKVVAGIDPETSERVADLYRKVCGKVFIAANIKTAEASKVLENTQRDLNIIFNSIGINTNEVLDTASTKWNFIRYSPGLVGGHCIPIVPYFFAHVAKEASYYPKVILAGRETNDYMPKYIAHLVIKGLNSASKMIKSSKVLILGLSYKENIADPRETPIRDTIRELKDFEVELYGYDPLITDIDREFGIIPVVDIERLKGVDCIIMTVGHDIFKSITLKMLRVITGRNPLLVDIRHFYDALEAKKVGFNYKTL
jgi:UDP-N-acetyl-D-galactosamine dehydrogenase